MEDQNIIEQLQQDVSDLQKGDTTSISQGVGTLNKQNVIPASVKPRDLVSDVIATGDFYYADSNSRLARLPIGPEGSLLDVTSGIPAWFPVGSSGQVLTIAAGVPAWATPASGYSVDGWVASSGWSYASASTITVPSGAAAIYQKGDRIKWTQTTVKYGVIVAVADTLLTIAVNTDYTVANAAITLPYYSHQETPLGYPDWFNWTPVYAGTSADPATTSKFNVTGSSCFVYYETTSAGTSNATTKTVTLPVTPINNSELGCLILAMDNGAYQTAPGHLRISGGNATASLFKTPVENVWTNSGSWRFFSPVFSYQI